MYSFFLQILYKFIHQDVRAKNVWDIRMCVVWGEKRIQLHISSLKKKKQIELLSKIGLIHYLPKSQHCLFFF